MISSEDVNLDENKFKNLINFKYILYFSFLEKLREVQHWLIKA